MMKKLLTLISTFFLILPLEAQRGEKDLIEKIPAISFRPNYKTYSGYLYANSDKTWKMHYLLTTSRSNKTTDPVVFWFNGGPGCSSLTGSFQENGPMYADADGKSLFENIYSWNKAANMVYMESPIGVGFSYDTTNVKYINASDDETVEQNFNAIQDFFTDSHPEFKNRDFYLSGESYAGIYVPMLAEKIAKSLDKFPNKNFRGILIGNGYLNRQLNVNTQILWAYYHGLVGNDEWNVLKKDDCCQKQSNQDTDACDWLHLVINGTSDKTPCDRALASIIEPEPSIDQYNLFQDCYTTDVDSFRLKSDLSASARRNPATYFNRQSTDPNQGYACYNQKTALAYFNRSDFASAFHIDKAFYDGGGVFQDCNDELAEYYKMQYTDMTPQFETILDKMKNFKILILNGDIDMVCNFLADSRFVKQLAEKRKISHIDRVSWYYRSRVGGYIQRYTDQKNSTIDVLTIKGAGHMTPMDRPGPALQMFTKFVEGATSYGDYEDKNTDVPDSLPYLDSNSNPIFNNFNYFIIFLLYFAF